MDSSLAIRRVSVLCALLGAAALALVPSDALAAAGTHTTLPDFQQNVRADVLLEPFNGADQNFFGPAYYPVSGGGYAYTVENPGGVRRNGNGIGGLQDGGSTQFTFTGRPVTAFAGTLRVFNHTLMAPLQLPVNITLSTGETFTVNVTPGGTFFGITTTQPFTSLLIDSPLHSPITTTYEWIDDAYVGTSGTAAAASDQCADAVTIAPNAAASYPFTTVGATAEASPGVCSGAIDTGPDVWFRLVSPVHGVVTLGTCECNFDSILRVFGTCAAATLGAQIACNDDFCTDTGPNMNRASQVSFRVVAGEDYLIRISGYNGASGSGNLTFAVVPDFAADFNHSGGYPAVGDIFAFLTAWFAGCP